jgi:ribosome maturation factor RimP
VTIEERIAEILASVGAGGRFSGVEVIRTAVHRERGGLFVRLTIDREGGVDTALCESISNYVVRQLDRLDPAIGPYHVEVESAGVERPLLKPEHFQRFGGRRARVITHLHIRNRTEFTGTIESANHETVTISDAAIGSVEIPYAAIKRANLTFEIRDDLRRK